MRFGGGVTITLGAAGDALASLIAPFPETTAFLKGFSAACMFPPVLRPKLEYNFWAAALHFGQVMTLSHSLSESTLLTVRFVIELPKLRARKMVAVTH